MRPGVAKYGIVAVIWLGEFVVKAALSPLKYTPVTPAKLVPVMTTIAPAPPLVGENPLMVGRILKSLALVAVPSLVVTVIFPEVA